MMSKRKLWASVVINAVIFLVTTGVVISYFFEESSEFMEHGYETFRFFTTDSNILAAISCLIMLIFETGILRGKRTSVPKWAVIFKFMGTVSLMLTFLTVMFFLVPIYGPALILGTYFHVHVGAPLMAIISFALLETEYKIRFPQTLLGIIPMAVYGCVYMTEVVLIGKENGGWRDFYQFNQGGRWYITMIVMLVSTFVISLLVALFHNKMLRPASDAKEKIISSEKE